MLPRMLVLCGCLLAAAPAAADTVVTWVGEGQVTSSYSDPFFFSFGPPVPIGTPISVSVTFDPSAQIPTPYPIPATGCMRVPFSGSFTLGGHTFNSPNSLAFSNGILPGDVCSSTELTQFSFHNIADPAGNPWPGIGNGPGVFILSYRDLLVQDAFPSEPTLAGNAFFFFDNPIGAGDWGFSGGVSLRALDVDQTPVPEPATLTLFGVGLALAHRARRRSLKFKV